VAVCTHVQCLGCRLSSPHILLELSQAQLLKRWDGPASRCSAGALPCAACFLLCILHKFIYDPLYGVLTSLLGELYASITVGDSLLCMLLMYLVSPRQARSMMPLSQQCWSSQRGKSAGQAVKSSPRERVALCLPSPQCLPFGC